MQAALEVCSRWITVVCVVADVGFCGLQSVSWLLCCSCMSSLRMLPACASLLLSSCHCACRQQLEVCSGWISVVYAVAVVGFCGLKSVSWLLCCSCKTNLRMLPSLHAVSLLPFSCHCACRQQQLQLCVCLCIVCCVVWLCLVVCLFVHCLLCVVALLCLFCLGFLPT